MNPETPRPIVATAVEGNLDAFLERHSGIYAQTTPRSVANAVCEILGAPKLAAALGAAAHLRAAMLFDLEITLPALADTINVLLEPRQRERAHADGR